MKIDRRGVLLGAAASGAAAYSSAFAATENVGGGRAHRRALEVLQAYAEQHRADWGLPGMTLVVVDRGGFAGYVRAGWAVERRVDVSAAHLFQVGSISKMMAALAVASLEAEAKLSRDAQVRALMPDVPIAGGASIVVQHLLNHTSGLPADAPLLPEGGLWTGFEPGSHWSYSNVGYHLLGLIAARADGRLVGDVVAARVLTPLGMRQSVGAIRAGDRARYAQGYEPATIDRPSLRPGPLAPAPWVETDNAAGCVAATASDMGLFLRYLLALGEGRGAPLLSDDAARAFLADPADAPGWAAGVKYGNGVAHVEIDGRRYLHHTGGMVSFCSSLHVDVEAGVGAFASANVSHLLGYRPRDVTVYACQVLRALREATPQPTPAPTRSVVDKPAAFTGVYAAAGGERIEIVPDGDQLRLRYDGRTSDMQTAGAAAFACAEPRFAETGLVFSLENEVAVRAWAGAEEFARTPSAGFRPPADEALSALAGRYDTDDRWGAPLTIVARDGRLWLGNIEPLTLLDDGQWRMSDEHSPERIRFAGFVHGRPTQMLFSGAPYVRRFS